MTKVKEEYRKALQTLKPFCKKNESKSNWYAVSTFVMLYGSMLVSLFLFDYSIFLSILLIPVTTIFMCRSYVIEHDCGHQSLFKSKYKNAIVGNIMGFAIMIPYHMWKYIHNSHHNHVGNLDKRDMNPEMWTLTVDEYLAASSFKKVMYQFIRSKFSRFIVAPIAIFAIIFRIPNAKFDKQSNISVIIHDLLYIVVAWFLLSQFGFTKILIVYMIPVVFFFTIASYMFYAQHQFEDTYWENEKDWNYEEATFKGSTYLTAPKWINWISGNVVYHNVHHLISTIPFYNLEKAQEKLGESMRFTPISIFKVYSLLNYKVWDEKKKKLIPIKGIAAQE